MSNDNHINSITPQFSQLLLSADLDDYQEALTKIAFYFAAKRKTSKELANHLYFMNDLYKLISALRFEKISIQRRKDFVAKQPPVTKTSLTQTAILKFGEEDGKSFIKSISNVQEFQKFAD